jgi:hypothetical protein
LLHGKPGTAVAASSQGAVVLDRDVRWRVLVDRRQGDA